MKSILMNAVLFIALAACLPKDNDRNTEGIATANPILYKKDSVNTLLNQEIDVTKLKLGSKENLAFFNGFKGLKLNTDFNKLIADEDIRVFINTDIDGYNFKQAQFKAYREDIKSGNGNIQFINLFYLNNKLKKIEINQKETWATVTAEDYISGNYPGGLFCNSFIKIFYSAFGKPDSVEYWGYGKKPLLVQGDFQDNLAKINNIHEHNRNHGGNSSLHLEWQDDKIIYQLSVTPLDNSLIAKNSAYVALKSKSVLLINDKQSTEILNYIIEKLASKSTQKNNVEIKKKIIEENRNTIKSL